MPILHRAIRLTALTTLTVLTGCAVMQPYVSHEALEAAEPVYTDKVPICPTEQSMKTSIERARRLQGLYEEAALDHNRFAVGTGLALIPLSAVVGYKAYVNNNPHNVAALAAGGFVGATGATYLYAPRQKIYFNGIQALDCAIDTIEPLALASETQRAEDKKRRDSLSRNWETVERAQQALAAVVENATCDSGTDQAAAITARLDDVQARQVDSARRVNEIQDALYSRSFLPKTDVLACNLDRAVQRIRTEVNLQLSTSTPSPADLAAQLGNLSLPTAGGGKTEKAKAPSALAIRKDANAKALARGKTCPSESSITDALSQLEQNLRALDDALSEAQSYLDRTSPVVYDPELLAACSLGATHPPVTISTAPDESLSMKTGQTLQVTIVGGYRPYAALVRNPPADAAELVVKIAPDGQTLTIKAGSKAAGTYTLVVNDKNGAAASAKLVVSS
ncbi:MAG TPA: hypothetical protein VMR06_04935 [Dokdonella sp.]|uniref:hypothetical protein n=1 Tax=Dokdonella sp. TaxID=2291710 RepID=UPI002BB40F90|nr:hypothetical protein [Dokdonella sp.]HUD41326.1 hypothetical protein [Dokdonella sp.]